MSNCIQFKPFVVALAKPPSEMYSPCEEIKLVVREGSRFATVRQQKLTTHRELCNFIHDIHDEYGILTRRPVTYVDEYDNFEEKREGWLTGKKYPDGRVEAYWSAHCKGHFA